MKMKTLAPEPFRLPGDIVLILGGIVPALLAAAWRFRNETAGATASQ